MAKSNLGSSEIKQLLADYESKQRRLQFEMDRIKGTIRNLKNSLPELEKAEAEQAEILATAEMDLGEVAIPDAQPAPKRGRTAAGKSKKPKQPKSPKQPKESAASKETKDRSSGYRLSEYDELVFDALNAHGRAMINSELVAYIEEEKKNKGENVEEGEVLKMVVRSLQKLANRRDDIKKTPYEGRGIAYALPEWLNGQGVIKKKHAHKA
jgi:hypothetical protein